MPGLYAQKHLGPRPHSRMGMSRPLSLSSVPALPHPVVVSVCVCFVPITCWEEGETQQAPRLTLAVEHPRWAAWGLAEVGGPGGKITEDEENYIFVGEYDSCGEQFGIWQEQFDRATLGCLGSEFFEYSSVLAWMPLPKPYKESEGV